MRPALAASACRPSSSSFPSASACAPVRGRRTRPRRLAPPRVRLRHERRRHRRRGPGPGRRRAAADALGRDRRRPARPTSAGIASRCRRRPRRACAWRWSACSRKPCSKTPRPSTSPSRRCAVAGPADLGRRRRPGLAAATSSPRCRRPACSSTASCRWPGPTTRRSGHFHAPAAATSARRRRGHHLGHIDGVATVRPRRRPGARAGAAAAAADDALDGVADGRRRAEHWLGAPVNVMPIEQRLLQAGRSLWNLRQFDLARRTRGARALRDWMRQAMSPAWRPVRIGRRRCSCWRRSSASTSGPGTRRAPIEARRAAIQALVKKTFPRVADGDIQRDAGRGDAARDAVAAHARRQGRRDRPRADAAGRRRGVAGRAPAGRDPPLRSRASSASPPTAGATRRSSSSARVLRPVGCASTRARAGSS